jgi:hypothetical protein
MSSDPPQYYISNGVRRAVAAREAGIKVIPAILKEPGKPDKVIYVLPDQLHSPKSSVSASDPRYRRIEKGMATPAGRARMPPVEIEALGNPGQAGSLPLRDVKLDP